MIIWSVFIVLDKLCVIEMIVILCFDLIFFIKFNKFWCVLGSNIEVVLFNIMIEGLSVNIFVIVICCFCFFDNVLGL